MDASSNAPLQTLLEVFADGLRASGVPEAIEFSGPLRLAIGPDRGLLPQRVEGCRYLPCGLDAIPAGLSGATAALRKLDPETDWREAPHHAIPKESWWDHAYAELIGPDGHFDSSSFRFGVYVQAPEMAYVGHAHGAEEFYMVLSGVADWEADGIRTAGVQPGAIRHHPAHMPHATFTGPDPLVALWAWRGDIGFESYRFV